MKKLLALLLALVMVLSLCACGSESKGNTETTITFTNEDGTEETLTYNELYAIYKENEIAYEEQYKGRKVVVEGLVHEIKKGTTPGMGSQMGPQDVVEFKLGSEDEESPLGITFHISADADINFAAITKGTKVRMKGNIYDAFVDIELLVDLDGKDFEILSE